MTAKKEGVGAVGIAPDAKGATGRNVIRGWSGLSKKIKKSRVQGWRDVRAGLLPPPIELGPNSIGWFEDELDQWLASRPRRTYTAPQAA
jgi:predicted DNA-binding transcriptional regulator AlpA